MAAFVILLFFCLVCGVGGCALRRVDWHVIEEDNERYYTPDVPSGVGGCALRRVDWHAIEEDNERYYTPDGYHIYYDRKILRRLYSQNTPAAETNDE